MDDDDLSGLLGILGLLALQAFLTMIYAAILNTRTTPMRELAENGDHRAQRVLHLTESTRLTLTFQLITLLFHFAIAALVVGQMVAPNVPANAGSWHTAALYLVALTVTALVTMTVGYIVPEAIGSSYANPLALWLGGVMRFLLLLLGPVLTLLLVLSKGLSSLVKSGELVNTITEEEIMTLVDAGYSGGTIEDEEKEMIYSVLQLDQKRISEMMIPRIDVTAVEINQTLAEAIGLLVQSGFSRVPVYEDSIDHVRGVLYAKDLLAHWCGDPNVPKKSIRELMRPAHFVPESKRADELLKELQARNVHLAIVIDEYGGTAGLVTIEDIIEEIIGDIRDEYDQHEEAEYEQLGANEYVVAAGIDLYDFNELLDADLPTEDSDTLGGYIYTRLGRVPVAGDVIEAERITLKVLTVEGRRIRKVEIIRKPRGAPESTTPTTETENEAKPKEGESA